MNLFIRPDNLFEEVVSILKKENVDVLDLFLVGSRLYRAHNDKSDFDLIAITKNTTGQSFNKGLYNITCFTKETFQDSLNKQKMLCLEAFFSDYTVYRYRNIPFKYELNENLLKENTRINTKATLEKAIKNNSKKHLIQAIRINCFKEQILEYGKIQFFVEANWLIEELRTFAYKNVEELILDYKDFLEGV